MKPILVPTLRYPRAWFCLGLVFAAIVVFFSLAPVQRVPQIGVSDKVEHAAAYALLAYWFATIVARWDYVYMMLALVALGGGIEIVQGLMKLGRQADLQDFAADCIGALVGLLVALTPLGRLPAVLERLLTRGK